MGIIVYDDGFRGTERVFKTATHAFEIRHGRFYGFPVDAKGMRDGWFSAEISGVNLRPVEEHRPAGIVGENRPGPIGLCRAFASLEECFCIQIS